jgi:hypothetical protein
MIPEPGNSLGSTTGVSMNRNETPSLQLFRRAGVALVLGVLLVALLLALTVRLDTLPPLWWDEGWTLTVARMWVEQGHYGLLLEGRPAPADLAAAFPVVAPIALGFRLFGVGVWQGRFVIALFSLATLALLHSLGRRLFSRPVANGTLFVLLLMPINKALHPVYIGRQVLAEMPMLFYALAGYAGLLSALRRPLRFMPLTMGLWGIALISKGQLLPFWVASLVLPLLITLFRRRWREAGLLGLALFGSFGASQALAWLQRVLLKNHALPQTPLSGLYEVTAVVTKASVRLSALQVTLIAGLPTLLGLGYAAWKGASRLRRWGANVDREIVRWALLALSGSWFAWYLLLSAGWFRYLFPATFIAGVFVSALLSDLTRRFDLPSVLRRVGTALKHLRPNRDSAGAILAILLVTVYLPLTLIEAYQFSRGADASVYEVADWINQQPPPGALIESYDSELFFLLDRPYHYPPPQIHVELIRRAFLRDDLTVDYDPLAADPDYLVVGVFGHEWKLYDPILATGAFRLLYSCGLYDVYERVR